MFHPKHIIYEQLTYVEFFLFNEFNFNCFLLLLGLFIIQMHFQFNFMVFGQWTVSKFLLLILLLMIINIKLYA